MTKDGWRSGGQRAISAGQVSVTDAGCMDFYKSFIIADGPDRNLAESKWSLYFIQNQGSSRGRHCGEEVW